MANSDLSIVYIFGAGPFPPGDVSIVSVAVRSARARRQTSRSELRAMNHALADPATTTLLTDNNVNNAWCPQVAGEDEVRLDEEMERVVWGDAAPRLPAAAAEPRRDSAAPPPYTHTQVPGECTR